MVVEYYFVGGRLEIEKSVFIKEMLVKDSLLRKLLNWKSSKDFTGDHPIINNAEGKSIVLVDFSSTSDVAIGVSPKEILGALKEKYTNKIKGFVACRAEYSMYGGIFTFSVDMNAEDGSIQYQIN